MTKPRHTRTHPQISAYKCTPKLAPVRRCLWPALTLVFCLCLVFFSPLRLTGCVKMALPSSVPLPCSQHPWCHSCTVLTSFICDTVSLLTLYLNYVIFFLRNKLKTEGVVRIWSLLFMVQEYLSDTLPRLYFFNLDNKLNRATNIKYSTFKR